MKKFIVEYLHIIAYAITGLVFGFSFFLLLLNCYHYRDLHKTYIKQESDFTQEENLKKRLDEINTNISTFNKNAYQGPENSNSLSSIKTRLDLCVRRINTDKFNEILSRKEINIQDVYEMQQFYQTIISNECLVKQLYEISLTENNPLQISTLPTMAPFFEDEINQLIKSTDYMQKIIKNNSSYAFSSDSSKLDLYDQTKDSYYSLLNDYTEAIDFMYDLSVWYKNIVGGVS